MIRAVLDSNVLVAGIPNSAGAPADAISAWQAAKFTLVTSEYILGEVAEAGQNRYWSSRFRAEDINAALMLLRTDAEVTSFTVTVSGAAAHHHDDPVIATAISGAASYLVTRDHALLALGNIEEVTIVSPRDFLDVLDRQKLGG